MDCREPTTSALRRLLKQAPGQYRSGPALAELLGISRTAVWKQVRRLVAEGYLIDIHPRRGYRLAADPDWVLPATLAEQLRTRHLGRIYHHLPSTQSTNTDAVALAHQGAPHGSLILAEQQTAGRGRLDRHWHAPPGRGLTFSLILRPHLPPAAAPQITLVGALALALCLGDGYGISAQIKWPNDVLIKGRKVAGLLTEMQSENDRIRFVVLGIGINCNQSPAELTGPFRYPATSIAVEHGAPIDRARFLARFLAVLEPRLEGLEERGFGCFREELEAYSETVGAEVMVELAGRSIRGKAEGLTPEGALKILTADGTHAVVWAGDVTRMTSNG